MKELVDKLGFIEREISLKRGDFSVFALLLREDAPDKWDLVVAAPWLERDKKSGLEVLTRKLRASLSSDELISLSRIVLLDEKDPTLEAIHRAVSVEHGNVEIYQSNFFGLEIKHGYVITSKKHKGKRA